MVCRITEGEFNERLNWIERLTYRDESLRGETSVDDCFQPGYFEVDLPADAKKAFAITCAAGVEGQATRDVLTELGDSFEKVHQAYLTEQNRMGVCWLISTENTRRCR